ncbi:MAG: prepilin-type N-terminal cleavage/methylation domain-containing protein [Patescibacteria group bacterium]|jgi:prepilin-type N-terminal cleavage/methylation domain-containing protein
MTGSSFNFFVFGFRNRQRSGFTLIEVIVTMALFSMTVLMAVTLLVVFIQQQRRAVSQEQLQNDIRAVIEQMSQELRESSIDYAFYQSEFPLPTGRQRLFTSLDGQANNSGDSYLAFVDAFEQRILYRFASNTLQRCVPTITLDCTDAAESWETVTPVSMQITNFTFYVSPSADPFAGTGPINCGTPPGGGVTGVYNESICRWGEHCQTIDGNGLLGDNCAFGKGNPRACYCIPQKFGEVIGLHPRVTFSIAAQRTVGQNTVSDIFQTTVASRVFQNMQQLNQYAP